MRIRAVAVAAGLVALTACQSATGVGTSPSAAASASTPPTVTCGTATATAHVRLVAKDIAFSTSCIAVPANTPFTIAFRNEDTSVMHDVHIFSANPTEDPSATSLFQGSLLTGPGTTTYHVPALPAGTYFFECDVHPQQMFGRLIAR
jgi:plastocyanin